MSGLTRDEFLDRFIVLSNLPASVRTPTGIKDGGFEREAVPCDCGDQQCPGWQLVKPETTPPVKVTVTATLLDHPRPFAPAWETAVNL